MRAYECKSVYKEHVNAEALSRLPRLQFKQDEEADQVLKMEVIYAPPISSAQVKQWTAKDVILSQVHRWCLVGWPTEVGPAFHPYSQRRLKLSVKYSCVTWRTRLVIPERV